MANELQTRTTAHRKAIEFDISAIAAFLQDAIGQSLTAHIANVNDAKAVGRWAKGGTSPRPESERRLREAFAVFQMLAGDESAYTVRAWFIGTNPQLDDDAPADALREGRYKEVHAAARAYLAGG